MFLWLNVLLCSIILSNFYENLVNSLPSDIKYKGSCVLWLIFASVFYKTSSEQNKHDKLKRMKKEIMKQIRTIRENENQIEGEGNEN
jgi:hypothetical protein